MDEIRIPAAGDPFTSKPVTPERDEEHRSIPHGCIDGWHYLGHIVVEDDGEEVEVIEQVRCKRCAIAEHHERL